MKDETIHQPSASGLSRHTFLNPEFMPDGVNEDYCAKHRASGLACDVWALISTIEGAYDYSDCGPSSSGRGISTTLSLAANLASDLIEACEKLEKELAALKSKEAV